MDFLTSSNSNFVCRLGSNISQLSLTIKYLAKFSLFTTFLFFFLKFFLMYSIYWRFWMYFFYYGIFKVILMILEVWWYLEDFLGYLAQFANVTYEYSAQFLFEYFAQLFWFNFAQLIIIEVFIIFCSFLKDI